MSDPSPLSSPVQNNPVPAEVISHQATPTPSIMLLPVGTRVPQVAQCRTSPAIGALKTVLGGLRDSLSDLPPLRMAVGGLLECIIRSEAEEQNHQVYNELASDVANLATLLQKHAFELKPHDGPYSISNVVKVIDEQTKLIKAQQERPQIGRLASAQEDEEVVLKCYRRIGALYQHLQTGVLLSLRDESKEREMDAMMKDLSPVHEAYHNAALPTSATKRVGCTQGTRVELLNNIRDWARGGGTAKIYWLNGMAGTGKTTVAYTLCEMLQQDNLLAASFFCSRNSADCQDVNRIIPTIAYQLGQYSSLYRQELFEAVKSNSDAAKRNAETQFKHLILEPIDKISQEMPKDLIVVIDAPDECSDETGTKIVLDMLIRHAARLPIKFFIASRPEPIISDSMAARPGALHSVLRLHDIEQSLVQADIKLYLTEALEPIDIFPSEIDQLAAKAGKLFIFAATAVRYIRPDRGAVNHRKRLLEVLELQPNTDNLRHQDIDSLYATILSNALNEKIYTKTELTTRRQVLWAVICAKVPLTISALSELLDIAYEDIQPAILPLQSVLHQSESTSVISALHASFPDFLLAKERAGQFHCDQVIQNCYLVECCFRSMSRSLKFNICELESSYVLDNDIPDLQTRVDKAIPTALLYSCTYWGDHLTSGVPSPTLLSLLDSFLQQHLLFWMEVLSLKGRIGHGEVMLSQVLNWFSTEDHWKELRDFTYDARNFLTSFAGNPTLLSTPHIYISVLPFTPKRSRVRTIYWQRMRGLIEIEGAAIEERGNAALATWNVGSEVFSIAQSSDGRRVASGSNDGVSVWDVSSASRILGPLKGYWESAMSVSFSPTNPHIASGSDRGTVRVWDAHSGDLVLGPLDGHTDYVRTVAFSPDGTRIASGSDDRTIRIWDAHTGDAIGGTYEGHQERVQSVVFSPGGEHLASGSDDRTIRVWDWRMGVAALNPLEGHTDSVRSIAYSFDGSRLASGSWDRTVRVWDMSNGSLLAVPFEGHTFGVLSVSFSPNGSQVVSGSYDRTIRVWEAESGNLTAGPFEGHESQINEILFTVDGTRILSGSLDSTIRVWDARCGLTCDTESLGHSGGINSIVVSPDGTRLASGSSDKTICVWDTNNGALVAGPFQGHAGEVSSVAFSPDGARIVSGSWDSTLRTWATSTGTLLAGPLEGHTQWVTSVAFSPDGSLIASGSVDYTIRLWDSYTGESVAEPFEGHTRTVKSVAFSPDGTRIVSASDDKTVRMWGAIEGIPIWTSDAHARHVHCVTFSPDGTQVVSGSDNSILVLNPHDGVVVHGPFTGCDECVVSVQFSPDETRVVSGSWSQTVHVWDVQSGAALIASLKGHTAGVKSVVFSRDGSRIISGSVDGTIRFWDLAAATQPDATSFNGWSINRDGWLTDSKLRRLSWVPPDLRNRFWFYTPANPLMIGTYCTTCVDSTTLLGDRWHECYDPPLRLALS